MPSAPSVVSLLIRSTPPGAQVFLDSHLVGMATDGPLTLQNLDPEEDEVVLRKEGFAPWAESIEVYPGESRSITTRLEKATTLDISGI